MIDLNTIWFLLIGVLITGYAILDGFDLGVGVLHLFAKDDEKRRIHINAIGPVWGGNEVWLIAGGGALFAAFPAVYATAFSSLYLALILLLVALIFRAVSFEFHGAVDSPAWRRFWDWAFGLGSVLPALLFGVAVGNILRGLPIDGAGRFTGSFLGLLNPYALLVGALSLVLCTMHGAIYLTVKMEGDLFERARTYASRTWIVFIVLYVLATIYTVFEAPYLFDGIFGRPAFWILLPLLLVSLIMIPAAVRSTRPGRAFLASAVAIASAIGLTAVSLVPKLIPSGTDLAYSLTISNASSTPKTHTVMLVIALIGMPLVVLYTVYIYRVFGGKVVLTEENH